MKKNILLVLPFCPYPLESGGHQAIFNGIDMLQKIANVFIVYAHTSWIDYTESRRKQLQEIFPSIKIFHFPLTEKNHKNFAKKITKRISRIFLPISNLLKSNTTKQEMYRSWGFSPQPDNYVSYINNIIKEYNIDIVQVEMCFQLSLVLSLPSHVKKIFIHHELRYVREELRLKQLKINIPKSYLEEVTIHKFEEIGLLNMYDNIVVLSNVDKDKLERAGVIQPILTSFAVVNSSPQVYGNNIVHNYTLTFVGPESHDPNYDGIVWFLESCWNQLLKKNERYILRIVGKWSDKTKKHLCSQYRNIEFMGFVENLYDVLQGTTMIVPIRIGSGIRMKILEAASYGVPVVSTYVGAEGLMLREGKDILLADNPDLFIQYILKLENEDYRKRLSENLQNSIAFIYSVEALLENRKELYI